MDNEDNLPDRLHDVDKLKDNIGIKIENDDENKHHDSSVVPVIVGKPGRKRKKRKFFDEENGNGEQLEKKIKVERRDSQVVKCNLVDKYKQEKSPIETKASDIGYVWNNAFLKLTDTLTLLAPCTHRI